MTTNVKEMADDHAHEWRELQQNPRSFNSHFASFYCIHCLLIAVKKR